MRGKILADAGTTDPLASAILRHAPGRLIP